MGEPTQPTEAERAATLELARSIVEAERNDLEWPKIGEGRARYNPFCSDLDEPSSTAVFRLAQDLTITTAERDEALKQSRLGWERAAENDRAYAGALRERDELARELERWRHNVTIEGDFVCPDSLELTEARAEVRRLSDVDSMAGRLKAIVGPLWSEAYCVEVAKGLVGR